MKSYIDQTYITSNKLCYWNNNVWSYVHTYISEYVHGYMYVQYMYVQ